MALASKNGRMTQHMRATGEMEWQKGREYSIIRMVTYMKVISGRIDQMVMENILILMVKCIKVCGKMICKKARV